MSPNVLIEASAGTGKTQALAQRLISLIRLGVNPQEIVALTFSRAAAGEIFERFVTLLADSALSDAQDADLLRKVIDTQHLSLIGTLDSFLMRIVRSFPLELGLVGSAEMMDEYAAASERARVSFAILRRTDAAVKRAFDDAFALAMNRENVRSFTAKYHSFIKDWHERYLAMPDAASWGDAARLGLAGLYGSGEIRLETFDRAELARCADALAGIVNAPAWAEFADWVRNFRGSFSSAKGFAKKFLESTDVFTGATVEIAYNRRNYAFGGREARAIREALLAVFGYVLRMKVEMARGVHTLISSFERDYARKVRQAGRLVFADIPRLILNLGEEARRALEYRLDARLRAWALDEFQDTSREQWKALSDLLDEAKQSAGEKSVFVVGDRKQAIYGWRNGDVSIFTRERDSGAYELSDLNKSWRYGEPIVEAINAVFVHGRIKDVFPTWEAAEHETGKPDLSGYVQVIEASGPRKEHFTEPVYNALRAVDPVRRGLSAAVLVRTNDFGERLAADLKRLGLEGVVWEGESAVLDTPVLLAFLDTLALADHPGDKQAYEHFRRSPLAAAKYGSAVPDAATVSGEFALLFSTRGIVRTFRELRACLPKEPNMAWSDFSERRFTDMLRAAAEFERVMKPGVRLADFADYLDMQRKRNVAEPGKIKVMTIHRSKGLGFDYVVLPLYEHEGLDAEPGGPLVGDDWILPDPGVQVVSRLPGLVEAWRRRKDRVEQEALCLYYVAMTRAKRAMTIVLHPESKTSKSVRFSQFVREAIPEPIGNPAWYETAAAEGKGTHPPEDPPAVFVRSPRQRIRRRLPSLAFHDGESAGDLFSIENRRKAAIDRGVSIHDEYEKIEWIEPTAARDDLERALVRPSGVTALWRERSFELQLDGEWVSGRLDRVVFANGRATVFDFKTNVRGRNESVKAFESRMRETYAGQMTAYRAAVSALTGISPIDVECRLLLFATKSAVVV